MEKYLRAVAVLEGPQRVISKILEDDQGLDSTKLKSLEGVVNAIADAAGVLADLLEIFTNELLLLDELDIAERLGRQLDGLVETVLATVRYIHDLDDLGLQTLVEHVGSVEVVLEVGGSGENDAGNVDLVGGDEVLNRQLGNLTDVVVPLFFSETGKTKSRLTTTTVLLGKIDGELVNHVTGVAAEGAKQGAVSVHDDEAELLIRFEQLREGLGVELVVTEVERGVDGLERFEIDVDLPLPAFRCQDFTTVDDQAVGRDLIIQLESLLG